MINLLLDAGANAAAQTHGAEGDTDGVRPNPPDPIDVGVGGLEVADVIGRHDLAATTKLCDREWLERWCPGSCNIEKGVANSYKQVTLTSSRK